MLAGRALALAPVGHHAASVQHGRRWLSKASATTSETLRQLMTRLAQPVVILTCALDDGSQRATVSGRHDHGATVSSFTSVALAPVPLVSFSMRLPSRLAQQLGAAPTADFRVTLLSDAQADLANRFAQGTFRSDDFEALQQRALGQLECSIISQIDLAALAEDEQPVSTLFVARVNQVSLGQRNGKPLLYYRRTYSSVNA
ncbi:uncharacterized protein L969DRAFT_52592 [Mixia osmundae IAM 14324]|uniref:Flavin reductase like domain-containing protein n=1 Tax=Mixia osmundae (strain CBS 9802 / IAM 14324 / JCM 22182 / KY 12970) TaxID=764103 RepID=G7E525_MIXOS|nr:uncharacterized protein L969DRAFT_52592 [Mixia osmundae IAM 14324]KEI37797.1 hypothetical protein L969DRAFT_52592 [Mixia osmundae IAM 14324]GAA97935.1 hypothetical protein E5Q_04615 [Mixia osmundae IAM 14324]